MTVADLYAVRSLLAAGDVFTCEESGERIILASTPQRRGGVRLWMRCPRCGLRAAKLYQPAAGRFACRGCHQLRYRSQSKSRADRWRWRAQKLMQRAGCSFADPFYYRPKGMHWRTFNRLIEEAEALDNAALEFALRGFLAARPWET